MEKNLDELPTLIGSEKQVEWAKKIRSRFISALAYCEKDALAEGEKSAAYSGRDFFYKEHLRAQITNYREEVLTKEDAKYFIDNLAHVERPVNLEAKMHTLVRQSMMDAKKST